MLLLRYFLRGFVFQLCVCTGNGKETHLRQNNVVSVGEGNVDCDVAHGSPCGDALHPHEASGVSLLPDTSIKSRRHAFNVHTMMMPQEGAALSTVASQNTGARLFQLAQKSGTQTIFLLGIFICIGFVLLHMYGSPDEPETYYDDPYAEKKNNPYPDAYGADKEGAWARAYGEAHGPRRAAMELLYKARIISPADINLPTVPSAHIEECIQVAAQMLQEKPFDEWIDNWRHAQLIFEERVCLAPAAPRTERDDLLREFRDCDGSWARAYVLAATTKGQHHRVEAFHLLLDNGYVTRADFRDQIVEPADMEESVGVAAAVAEDLLKSQGVASVQVTPPLSELDSQMGYSRTIDPFETSQSLSSLQMDSHQMDYLVPPGAQRTIIPPKKEDELVGSYSREVSFGNLPPSDTDLYEEKTKRFEEEADASSHSQRPALVSHIGLSCQTLLPHQQVRGSVDSNTAQLCRMDTDTSDFMEDGDEDLRQAAQPQLGRGVSDASAFYPYAEKVTDTSKIERMKTHKEEVDWGYFHVEEEDGRPGSQQVLVDNRSPRSQQLGTAAKPIFVLPVQAGAFQEDAPGQYDRLPTPERPRSMNLPSQKLPAAGQVANQGVPVKIRFAEGAVPQSSWDRNVTPPSPQKFPRGA